MPVSRVAISYPEFLEGVEESMLVGVNVCASPLDLW